MAGIKVSIVHKLIRQDKFFIYAVAIGVAQKNDTDLKEIYRSKVQCNDEAEAKRLFKARTKALEDSGLQEGARLQLLPDGE